ncbi:polyadenylate-binding protein 2 [Dromaius novaehollandiae]|uniref:polyadenylate-binding protein 2 n=1 Tax=Dromaius novaehollandiae TaxID=8790 RepID=UPI00311F2DE4
MAALRGGGGGAGQRGAEAGAAGAAGAAAAGAAEPAPPYGNGLGAAGRAADEEEAAAAAAALGEAGARGRGGGARGGGGGGGAGAALGGGPGPGAAAAAAPHPPHEAHEELEEEAGLGDGDPGDSAIEDPELEAIKARVREMEEEAEKLKELQNEVEKQMNMSPPPGNAGPVIMSLEEKMEADARSIYVGNVDYGATAEELEAHFHGCGSVNRVTILCDKYSGHPKGFAYIEFSDKESVRTSMALDESLFRGRQIKVIPKRTNRPGISTTDRGFPRARYRGRGGGYSAARARFYSGYSRPRGRAYRGRARATSWYSPY